MRLLLAAATALVMVPVAASATAWYLFFEDSNTSWYIDADTIAKKGDWSTVVQFARYHAVSERTGVKSVKATVEIDCKRRVYRISKFEPFGADGTSLGAMDNPEDGKEHENVSGSANDLAMRFVCDNERAGKTRVADPSKD